MGRKKGAESNSSKEEDSKATPFVNLTPHGLKKDCSGPIPEAYDRASVECAWDAWWQAQGFYRPANNPTAENFVMVIPPPNVTGTLHLGHALTSAIEDSLTRWNRMKGRNVLWVPGIDHAGIATQVVVEKKLWKTSKLTRHDIGREKFLEEVWKWKEENGNKIVEQIRRLGSSCDWDRMAFTMDEKLCVAVTEAFKRMHQQGIIFRANRLVNWSCHLRTAISNVEVEPLELKNSTFIKVPGHEKSVEFGVIHSFAYKLADDPNSEIIVATTRIETMLGDVAVAVHPEDQRYKDFHGRKLKHPFHDRLLDIVLDPELVNMEFGTGAVKVTPAHDPNDFNCGKRHNLEMINIFTDEGRLNSNGGKFEGMMRYDVRRLIIKELEDLNLYRGKENNPMVLGKCQRSGDIVEPILKPQWWVDCANMAKRAADSVRNGDLQIIPKSSEKIWFHFLDNIQDWCISRQLWWGHRIPAYRVLVDGKRADDDSDGHWWVVASSAEEAIQLAKNRFGSELDSSKISVEQDEDVLDTWFSSGLFPFSVFGWPNPSKDFDTFYPTNLLETGHDILFFWVARMVMMGLQLTDKLPFKTVFLHPMVRDKYGRKMSKSLGNVVDPLDVIEGISLEALHVKLENGNLPTEEIQKAKAGQKKDYPKGIPECGADALRFALLDYLVQERNVNLDVDRVHGYRQFCNKLWQATKFCLSNFASDFAPSEIDLTQARFVDKWILSRLSSTCKMMNDGFANFKFSKATSAIYDFWLKDFCSVYVEACKPLFFSPEKFSVSERRLVENVLYECLDKGLRLIHPVMPFVSEELFQRLPGRGFSDSIMISVYPEHNPRWSNDSVEEEMNLVLETLHIANSSRSNLDIPLSARPKAFIKCSTPDSYRISMLGSAIVESMAKLDSIEVLSSDDLLPKGCVASVVSSQVTLFLSVEGLINFEKQIDKLQKRVTNIEKWIIGKEKMTSQPQYQLNTPEDVREKHSTEISEKKIEKQKLNEAIKHLESLKLCEQ